jgi:hypothetical protein
LAHTPDTFDSKPRISTGNTGTWPRASSRLATAMCSGVSVGNFGLQPLRHHPPLLDWKHSPKISCGALGLDIQTPTTAARAALLILLYRGLAARRKNLLKELILHAPEALALHDRRVRDCVSRIRNFPGFRVCSVAQSVVASVAAPEFFRV